MPVESIEHTADLRLKAWGHSFQGTLLELSNHVLRLIYGKSVKPGIFLTSEVEYDSLENCVVRLLNDLLYESESSVLALRVKKITVCEGKVRWEGFGEPFSRTDPVGSVLIKAATYDRIRVSRDPPEIEMTFDI